MTRTLVFITLAAALAVTACAKKGSTPPPETPAQTEELPEPTDDSVLDESDETPKQPAE